MTLTESEKPAQKSSTSVEKTFALLETMSSQPDGWGVTQLSKELGLTKSNVHRLLQTLVQLGYVRLEPEKSLYFPTLKFWEIGSRIAQSYDLKRIAHPYMTELARKLGVTVHLSVLEGLDVVYIDRVEFRGALATNIDIGSRAPAQCVATGLAQMAFLPERDLALWDRPLPQPTPHSPPNFKTILMLVEKARTQGYAKTRGSWRPGVFGLAAPVFGMQRQVVGAIGISCVDLNITEARKTEFAEAVLDCTRRLTDEFGEFA